MNNGDNNWINTTQNALDVASSLRMNQYGRNVIVVL